MKTTKKCSNCKKVKRISNFNFQKSSSGKLVPRYVCTDCDRVLTIERQKKTYQKLKANRLAYQKKYYQKNIKKQKAYQAEYRKRVKAA